MYVAVPYEEYVNLIACQMQYDMLHRDGVDNWEWYGASYDEVAQDWCADADVPYSYDEYDSFKDVAKAIVAKAIELGNINVFGFDTAVEQDNITISTEGDDEGNE